ncbi:Cryparin [Pseudocercospora fuligena]|uniref:Cryparin n=1 Tax=Pseudocercospora fuligena TaxID=685502 RepID=A0A8H6RR46_9PEZI|nr:Cryparin [Pseudocercospora fuligena]
MQFILLAFAALAAASPLLEKRAVCPALDTPLCCQLDVEGLVDTPCETPDDATTKAAFTASCASTGYTAMCCTLPLAGDGILCNAP